MEFTTSASQQNAATAVDLFDDESRRRLVNRCARAPLPPRR